MSPKEAFKERVGRIVSAERYYTGVKQVPREKKLEPVDSETVENFKAGITDEEKKAVAQALKISVGDLEECGGALEAMLRVDIGGEIRANAPGLERCKSNLRG